MRLAPMVSERPGVRDARSLTTCERATAPRVEPAIRRDGSSCPAGS